MPKVSVLVAVYNAVRFLPLSIGSLLRQTVADIQIICVDDHSEDGSLQLLNEYARRDARIAVISLSENGGQAHARNIGLQQACGTYTCFLDADDTLSADALEKAVEVFENHQQTDAVLFDCRMLSQMSGDDAVNFSGSTSYQMPAFEVLSSMEAFRQSLDWTLHGVYILRTSIFKMYPYDETCRLYSDDNTTRIHYIVSREVRKCSGAYFYLQHAASMTHGVSVRRFDYLRANESMVRQMKELHVSQDLLDQYENHRWLNLIDVYMFYFNHGKELPDNERSYGLSELIRVWRNIDRSVLDRRTIRKFGYRPCSSWRIFCFQENLYFLLRRLLGR